MGYDGEVVLTFVHNKEDWEMLGNILDVIYNLGFPSIEIVYHQSQIPMFTYILDKENDLV